eukprot:363015-Chlamydomonas_euryale.AAC.2
MPAHMQACHYTCPMTTAVIHSTNQPFAGTYVSARSNFKAHTRTWPQPRPVVSAAMAASRGACILRQC